MYWKDYLVVEKQIRERTIEQCVSRLSEFEEFDAIAFCGNSGALVGSPVAFLAKKDVLVVRKDKEKNQHHSAALVEGLDLSDKKFIIIDDFMSSGNTIKFIRNTVIKAFPTATLVGILLYKDTSSYRAYLEFETKIISFSME